MRKLIRGLRFKLAGLLARLSMWMMPKKRLEDVFRKELVKVALQPLQVTPKRLGELMINMEENEKPYPEIGLVDLRGQEK